MARICSGYRGYLCSGPAAINVLTTKKVIASQTLRLTHSTAGLIKPPNQLHVGCSMLHLHVCVCISVRVGAADLCDGQGKMLLYVLVKRNAISFHDSHFAGGKHAFSCMAATLACVPGAEVSVSFSTFEEAPASLNTTLLCLRAGTCLVKASWANT